MRYILNISPEDAAARLRAALRGTVEQSLNNPWKTDPKSGFYGAVSADRFEMGFFDGLISPHPLRLLQARLKGTIREASEGCAVFVRFCLSPIVWFLLAVFFCAAVNGLLNISGVPEAPAERFLFVFGALFACVIFSVFLLGARKRNYRELEAVFSGCIVEKQK